MKKYRRKSHAKINLTLEVIEKLPNGYHKLRTVMMQLPHLFDDIEVTFSDMHNNINIICNDPNVPTDEKNICHKVVQAYCAHTGKCTGADIILTKRIPAAAGMGGGSSNGSQVLLCLNDHCDNILSQSDLIDVAATVGKDIPFFLAQSGCARIEGMGEVIAEEIAAPQMHIIVINPQIEVSTPWAFGELGQHLWFLTDVDRQDRSKAIMDIIRAEGDVAAALYNDFETAVFAHHPVIAEIKHALIALGAKNALMSGSGSTVFGVFEDEKQMHTVREKMQNTYPHFFITFG